MDEQRNINENYVINIEKSLNSLIIDDEKYYLQQDAIRDIRGFFDEHSKKLEGMHDDDKLSEVRAHDSIFISGPRGSGKTTFLLNIKNFVNKCECKKKPYVLEVIDPTLLHENDNFISIVLGRINEAIGSANCSTESYCKFAAELAKVGNTIQRITKSKTSEGLENILDEQNGLRLESEIHSLLHLAVDNLKCGYLILPIDDIDMSFKFGFEVLDRIRKYFASPYIIPVISGDYDTYFRIFACEFYKEMTCDLPDEIEPCENVIFERELPKNLVLESKEYVEPTVKERKSKFMRKACLQAELYLQKLLPKNRRIHLLNVKEILDKRPKLDYGDGKKFDFEDEILKIISTFNLGCGMTSMMTKRWKRRSFRTLNPVPMENLRSFIRFFSIIKNSRNKTGNFDVVKLNECISNFYRNDKNKVLLYNVASANFKSFNQNGNFDLQRFAMLEEMENYFPFYLHENEKVDKVVPYYRKDDKFPEPKTACEKSLYIFSLQRDIYNGSRIFISPDKFFVWITKQIFGSEAKNNDSRFGFHNRLFLNDYVGDDSVKQSADDSEINKSADIYEKIKYGDPTHKNLELKLVPCGLECSARLLFFLYYKFRRNINALLNNADTDGMKYSEFLYRMIIIYVNALAWITTESPYSSDNDICVSKFSKDSGGKRTRKSAKDIFPIEKYIDFLKKYNLSYKWNITSWKNKKYDEDSIQKLLTYLLDTFKDSGTLGIIRADYKNSELPPPLFPESNMYLDGTL